MIKPSCEASLFPLLGGGKELTFFQYLLAITLANEGDELAPHLHIDAGIGRIRDVPSLNAHLACVGQRSPEGD